MVERGVNELVKKVLRFAVATAITVASYLPGENATNVESEVGSLTVEPILLMLDPGKFDPLQYKPWNLGRVWPGVDISPELFVRALDKNNIPDQLLLATTVETDGLAKICAYNYPETRTCHEILSLKPDKSYYLFDTGVLDPGRVYGEIGSTRLRVLDSPGTFTITMELIVNDQTKGLVSSASTIIDVPHIYREYLPYTPKNGRFPLTHLN